MTCIIIAILAFIAGTFVTAGVLAFFAGAKE